MSRVYDLSEQATRIRRLPLNRKREVYKLIMALNPNIRHRKSDRSVLMVYSDASYITHCLIDEYLSYWETDDLIPPFEAYVDDDTDPDLANLSKSDRRYLLRLRYRP